MILACELRWKYFHVKDVSIYSNCFVLFFNIKNDVEFVKCPFSIHSDELMDFAFGSLYMMQCIHIKPKFEPSLHSGITGA